MPQTCKSPARTGLSRDQLGGSSQFSDSPLADQAQHLAARHHIRPALLEAVATAAFGGGRG